mgnify:CR=1 FL=1
MTKSAYGDRDTVGTIALDAALHGERGVCAGDMGHELMPGLVEDLNNVIASDPYNGNEFYITIHETKDAQIPNLIRRRMVTSLYRPFPEVNTSVWRTNPKAQKTWFCWSLPHWSIFEQCLVNPEHYGEEQIADIKAFKTEQNEHFGFAKVGKGWLPKEGFQDRDLDGYKPKKENLIVY